MGIYLMIIEFFNGQNDNIKLDGNRKKYRRYIFMYCMGIDMYYRMKYKEYLIVLNNIGR